MIELRKVNVYGPKAFYFWTGNPSTVRASNAFRAIAWDEGSGKYKVHGSETRVQVSCLDAEGETGLLFEVLTFRDNIEQGLAVVLASLGARPYEPAKSRKVSS
jgi:hypothetical protein